MAARIIGLLRRGLLPLMAARVIVLLRLTRFALYRARVYLFLALVCLVTLDGITRIDTYEQYVIDDTDIDFRELEYFDEHARTGTFRASVSVQLNFSSLVYRQSLPSCPTYPRGLQGILDTDDIFRDLSWAEIRSENRDISQGGKYAPEHCAPRYKVAIIIPLRGRDSQLRTLLAHMHPIWKRQNFEYRVFVISQIEDATLYNKAKVLNAGVSAVRKDGHYDCYVFQDVDILLEDDRCLYWCHHANPRHLAMYLDKFRYKPLVYNQICPPRSLVERTSSENLRRYINSYFHKPKRDKVQIFGGVVMMNSAQFDNVNGLSNIYWGWGGEDDDLSVRVKSKGYAIENPYGERCSFRMIPHHHEKGNAKNVARHALLSYASARMANDGYFNTRFRYVSYEEHHLYTNITVDVGRPSREMVDFISQSLDKKTLCTWKMPWMKQEKMRKSPPED